MQNLASPKVIHEILKTFHVAPHKQFGQNFLFDAGILAKIADSAEVSDGFVLEIGPGLGSLTQQLALRARHVVCVEIDNGFIPILEHTLSDFENVTIIHGDILKQNLQELHQKLGGEHFSVCANLPYYITTPIIMDLLESGLPWQFMCFLVQKEVGERMAAKPGSKIYGSLSLAIQYFAEVETVCKVAPTCFIPQPNVDSIVIKLSRKPASLSPEEEKQVFALIRAAFSMRRKTLVNNIFTLQPDLSKAQVVDAILAIGHDERVRAEQLSFVDFVSLNAQLTCD